MTGLPSSRLVFAQPVVVERTSAGLVIAVLAAPGLCGGRSGLPGGIAAERQKDRH